MAGGVRPDVARQSSRARMTGAPQEGPRKSFVTSPALEVDYGGARGGGKTDAAWGISPAMRRGCQRPCGASPPRRPGADPSPCPAIFAEGGARWLDAKSRFEWPCGARLDREGAGANPCRATG